MSVTFVKTHHIYDSYSDYWKLVELSGYPTCYADEMDVDDGTKTYILPTRNGEWGEGWPQAKARLIHHHMEWDAYPPMPGITEVWHSDKWFAEQIGARYVPLGSHVDLKPNADSFLDAHYDVAYLGYFIPRRDQIRHDLEVLGVKCSPIHAWGEERHKVLSNSTAYLHVHQHADKPGVPALRMVVAAAYSLPVISERCANRGIFEGCVPHAVFDALASYTQIWLNDPEHQRGLANSAADLHERLCRDYTFRMSIEAAV